ncbi:MAG TPA: DUF6351 family protein [Candidatus Saccharimonadales bacterium]|jgi:hypothetical protein|nr:DUF6351 family protein [Candidatus Saccharimonadales bacterium]
MKPARIRLSCIRIALTLFMAAWAFSIWESSQAWAEVPQAPAKAVAHSSGPLEIKVLSSRPDMVSGGDALVEVKAPAGTGLHQVMLELNGKDVSNLLKHDPESGTFRALVGGMVVGKNTLRASTKEGPEAVGVTKSPGHRLAPLDAALTVTNYPITGPILSGPHISPYECRTFESGLGEPLDRDCSAAPKTEYFYRTSSNIFKPLTDLSAPRPSDLVTTTTNEGKTVPYIVRVDSGTINRTIYRIAMLDDPHPTAAPWTPGPGWNRKLAVVFGGGAGTQYNQGMNQASAALNHVYLSRGFAFIAATELVNQLHSNAVLQGEALMMIKEHFIKTYGLPKWTVGFGGSGGAIQQLLITEMYPGLLDGLQPSLSFPDSSLQTADSGLLQNFWRKADPAIWTDAKKSAVEGYTRGTTAAWERSFVPVSLATNARGCALKDDSKVYDPVKNPKGVRCTSQEMRVNIYGRDPKTGFARKGQDNVGVQYGLLALNHGVITVDEFLELNQKIGGNDIDGNYTSERVTGDPIAIRAAYQSGLLNSGGGGLATVPILHTRPYADQQGDIHDRERDFTIRARLQNANGRSDNQVIWLAGRGENYQTLNVDMVSLALDTMNQWLDKIAADPAPPSTDRVVRNKPAEAVDACWDGNGHKIVEPASFSGEGKCNALYPVHGEPRLAAGTPLANDILKCQLKPIEYGDYKVAFTGAQKARMAAVFPDGVCDFTRPGVEQVGIKGTYQQY